MKKIMLVTLLFFVFFSNVYSEELPSYYNLKNVNGKNYVTSIKNQRSSTTCWSFGVLGTIESNILFNYGKSYDFSELHMVYMSTYKYFNDGVNSEARSNRLGAYSGNHNEAAAYFTKLKGPILESEFPFDNYYDSTNSSSSNNYLKSISLSELDNMKTIVDVNDIIWFGYDSCTSSALNDIKSNIMSNGAVSAQFYTDSAYRYKNYLYNDSNSSLNHYISIIGWDDNLSKSYFKEGKQPNNNGAFIVKNSWGDGGYNGIYYVSYEDINICKHLSVYKDIDFDIEDNVYYYDNLGHNYGYGYGGYNYTAWAANKFKHKTQGAEILKEVTIGTRYNTDYEIYITYEEKGDINLDNRELIGKGNISHMGYGTHKFDNPIIIDRDFAIIVKYTSVDKVDGYPICVQSTLSSGYENTILYENQSFVSKVGSDWYDLYNNKEYTSIPSIKAYTNNLSYNFNINGVSNDNDKFNIFIDYSGINSINEFSINIYDSDMSDVSSKFNISRSDNNIIVYGNDGLDNGKYKISINYGYITKEVIMNISKDVLEFKNVSVFSSNGREYLMGLSSGSVFSDLKGNINTNYDIKLYKSDGKSIIGDSDIVGTGMILMIDSKVYEMVIRGDINGDGKNSIIDLSQLRQHLAQVSGKVKSGSYLLAGDLNGDNNVSIIDLSKMRKELAG